MSLDLDRLAAVFGVAPLGWRRRRGGASDRAMAVAVPTHPPQFGHIDPVRCGCVLLASMSVKMLANRNRGYVTAGCKDERRKLYSGSTATVLMRSFLATRARSQPVLCAAGVPSVHFDRSCRSYAAIPRRHQPDTPERLLATTLTGLLFSAFEGRRANQ